jgi:CRISPR-associated protein (TIGR03986 family)
MPQEKVIKYDKDKGYGFIFNPDPKNRNGIFFHRTSIITESWIPEIGDLVEFEITKSEKGLNAIKVAFISQEKSGALQKQINSNSGNEAHAPYNFVPLNEILVTAPKENEDEEKLTGHILLQITTKTPIYIRGTLEPEDIMKKQTEESMGKRFIKSEFFSPGKVFRIPGSSLRGMVRTLTEIASHGRFDTYKIDNKNDKTLYYRAVADTSSLGEEYKSRMVDKADGHFPRIKAGLLKKKGNSYFIYPSKTLPKENGTQIYRINTNIGDNKVAGLDCVMAPFDSCEVYFKPVSPGPNSHKNGRLMLKYAKLASVKEKKDDEHPQKGFLVSSGVIRGKHMHWVINEEDPNEKLMEIRESVIRDYREDKKREVDGKADLLKYLDGHPNDCMPCFYLVEKEAVKAFGHTGMFRLVYDKSIADHIPDKLISSDPDLTQKLLVVEKKQHADELISSGPDLANDLAQKIFGNIGACPGRVFFEDAFYDQCSHELTQREKVPKILSTPKPTAFPHYLEQGNGPPLATYNYDIKISTDNKKGRIRGYKMYWHRSIKVEANGKESWEDSEVSCDNIDIDKDKQHTLIEVVNLNKMFVGRIRFEELTCIELGALLFSVDLPGGCFHKIGMGKPLGLGSIQIEPKLYISNRKTRYENVSSEWKDPIKEEGLEKIKDLKNEFAKCILAEIKEIKKSGQDDWEALWDVDRMQELRRLLAFAKGNSPGGRPDDTLIDYMTIRPFKARNVLPRPTQVGNKHRAQKPEVKK